jgi:hypothetical protein
MGFTAFTLLRKPPPLPPTASGLLTSGVAPLTAAIVGSSLYGLQAYREDMGWGTVGLPQLAGDGELALVSPSALLLLRLLRLAVVGGLCVALFTSGEGKTMDLEPPHGIKFNVKGLARFTTFTSWSWALQGAYFASAAYCSALHLAPGLLGLPSPSAAVLDVTWVLYEVSLATSMLVTVVVTFVLFPAAARLDNTALLLFPDALMMHNLNVVFMAAELVLTAVPVQPTHFIFAVLWGSVYVMFSWLWLARTGVVYYFFLDYRKPKAAAMMVGLLIALTMFYFLGWGVSVLGPAAGVPPLLTAPLTAAATFCVLKWK